MKVILAQGNPGTEYTQTRHNAGWVVLDFIAKGATFKHNTKFKASLAEITKNGEKVLLVKPDTFYNLTGESARRLLDFYKLSPQDLLVIHDDTALDLGVIRARNKGSDGGNNGIKSLNAHIGQDYWRLRLGIGSGQAKPADTANFVLGRFSKEEFLLLETKIAPAAEALVEKFATNQLENTSLNTI